MRVAFIPVEKKSLNGDDEIVSSTRLAYLLSYFEKQFPEDRFFVSPEVKLLLKSFPDLVGIYIADTCVFEDVIALSIKIKEQFKIPIFIFGAHITYVPMSLPNTVDIGIIGEGEPQMQLIFSYYKLDPALKEKTLSKIKGIVFHSKGRKVVTDKVKQISNLDLLPSNRKLLYSSLGNWKPSIISGRGYPYHTKHEIGFDLEMRLHSAERLLYDILDIITFYPNNKVVDVLDTLFLQDIDRLREFAHIYKEGKLAKYVRLNIKAKANQLNDEVLELLKYSFDVNSIFINFISPSEKKQKELREPIVTQVEQIRILEKCQKLSLNVTAFFYLGFPNETREEIAKTYWDIKNNYLLAYDNLKIKVNFLIPLPGSEIWLRGVAKKQYSETQSLWSAFDSENIQRETPLLTPHIEYEEIEKILLEFSQLKIKNQKKYLLASSKEAQRKLDLYKSIFQIKEDKLEDSIRKYYERATGKELDFDFKKGLDENLSNRPKILEVDVSNLNLVKEDEISIAQALAYLIKNVPDFNFFQDNEELEKIVVAYNRLNLKNNVNQILYGNQLFTLSVMDNLEKIIKNTEIKSILQITDTNSFDLKSIFIKDEFEIDSIENIKFLSSEANLPLVKKYDCIMLFFTLDIALKPFKVLQYCERVLNHNGLLLINFLNPKSLFVLNHLISSRDVTTLFDGYKRSNFISIEVINNLLSKYNFTPKNITNIVFPSRKFVNTNQRALLSELITSFEIDEERALVFSYNYALRKK